MGSFEKLALGFGLSNEQIAETEMISNQWRGRIKWLGLVVNFNSMVFDSSPKFV